jgi:hypothetical protein
MARRLSMYRDKKTGKKLIYGHKPNDETQGYLMKNMPERGPEREIGVAYET